MSLWLRKQEEENKLHNLELIGVTIKLLESDHTHVQTQLIHMYKSSSYTHTKAAHIHVQKQLIPLM